MSEKGEREDGQILENDFRCDTLKRINTVEASFLVISGNNY